MIFSKKKTFKQKPIQVKYNQINYQTPFHFMILLKIAFIINKFWKKKWMFDKIYKNILIINFIFFISILFSNYEYVTLGVS